MRNETHSSSTKVGERSFPEARRAVEELVISRDLHDTEAAA